MRGRRGSSTHPFHHIPLTRTLALAPLPAGKLETWKKNQMPASPWQPLPQGPRKGKDSLKVHVGVVGNAGTGPGNKQT